MKRTFIFLVILIVAPTFAQRSFINETNVRAEMYFLASDAMQGRGSAGPYERVAAEYIGSQFMQFGLEPAGDAGFDGKPTFVQTVAFKRRNGDEGKTYNAIGKLTGTDKTLGAQVILISSHLDHLGVRENAPGDDKIFNGADDDASGSVAVLEVARTLANSKIKPRRTVYFVCFGSEEIGGFGANYFVNHLPFAKEKLVANLEWEMMGRPDPAVKSDQLWLTGYDRSNLGPELAKRGAKLVPDPHPEQNFFQRSDNYTLAKQGIIAQTVSSYGLHADYHKASDEVKTIDFTHMTRSIESMLKPIQWLVNSNFVPTWKAGQKP